MAEALLIGVVMLAGFVVVFVMNAQGAARAFEQGEEPGRGRAPEASTPVDLPPPRFSSRSETNHRRREA